MNSVNGPSLFRNINKIIVKKICYYYITLSTNVSNIIFTYRLWNTNTLKPWKWQKYIFFNAFGSSNPRSIQFLTPSEPEDSISRWYDFVKWIIWWIIGFGKFSSAIEPNKWTTNSCSEKHRISKPNTTRYVDKRRYVHTQDTRRSTSSQNDGLHSGPRGQLEHALRLMCEHSRVQLSQNNMQHIFICTLLTKVHLSLGKFDIILAHFLYEYII